MGSSDKKGRDATLGFIGKIDRTDGPRLAAEAFRELGFEKNDLVSLSTHPGKTWTVPRFRLIGAGEKKILEPVMVVDGDAGFFTISLEEVRLGLVKKII